MNLVGNAIKFTAEGTVRITVEVEDQDRQSRLIIDITDTGPGMTPEQVQGLFKPFGQSDSSVTRKHGGTGLGLVICRRLANLLGGDVTILFSEIGKGSCFRIVLPFEPVAGSNMIECLSPITEKDEPKPTAVEWKLSGRFLLAEDGVDNQRLIAFLVRKAGATIEIADNGRIALDMLDQAEAAGTPYDMLLTDMQMPEMDGYSLASILRGRGSKIPIIALTAHAMADDRKRCIDAGCDDYVSKPIDKADLITTCAAWIGKTSEPK
jgi:CheY-like chemotaxis protein